MTHAAQGLYRIGHADTRIAAKGDHFAARIRRYRYELDLSQTRMARALGIPTDTLQEWEQARSLPAHPHLIEQAYGRLLAIAALDGRDALFPDDSAY